MHAKKPILLYCADRDMLSATAFALRLHPYDVAAVHDGRQAITLAGSKEAAFCCGVLMHTQQGDPAGRVTHCLLDSGSQIPLLLVDRIGDLAPVRYADMVLYGRNTSMAHMLSALEILCRRTRGPRAGATV